jgi:hypothetical protein
MSGGSTSTSTTSNAPPQQYLDAYSNVLARAQGVANTPYQPYPGQLVADFTPAQIAGMHQVYTANGAAQPYIDQARQYFQQANAPLAQTMQPYSTAAGNYFNAAGANNPMEALSPWQRQAASGFSQGSAPVSPTQFSAGQVQQYLSPYTQNVVDATQAQFNNQNQQQANQLRGNAASQGALGSDRVGVAQAVLANQQQMAQAPVIAGLYNQGYGQALQEFNTQQGVGLQSQLANRQLQQQAAQGYAGLGSQAQQAAAQQAAIEQAVGQGYAGLGQQQLGAGQAQGWLAAQTGAGLAGLGNQALSSQLTGANALLGVGAQQQQQQQQELNIPYEQWLAQRSYPFQTTGWLSNIAQGLGSASGGTSTSTVPTAGVGSQLLGAGIGTAALLGATGAFGNSNNAASGGGWLTGSNGLLDAGYMNMIQSPGEALAAEGIAARGGGVRPGMGFAQGGSLRGFAAGGVPDVSQGPINMGQVPGSQTIVVGSGVPDVSASVVPGGGASPAGAGFIKRDWGSTTHGEGGPSVGSQVGQGLMTAAELVAMFAKRGGHVPSAPRGFAAGGSAPIAVRGFADGGDLPPPAADYNSAILNPDNFLPPPLPEPPPAPTPPASATPPAPTPPSTPPGPAHPALVGATPPPGPDTTAPVAPPAPARTRGNPAAVAAAAHTAPPVQPPPPHSDYGTQGGQSSDAFDRLMDRLEQTRAHSEDRANPWLALATAGFGMAAGKSPHMLQNLGEGAVLGIKQYLSSDEKAKELASKVDEHMAQLATAQAYHQATIGTRERGQDMNYQAREDARQNAVAIAMIRAASAAARAGSEHVTTGDLMAGAVHSLMGQINPDTGKPYTQMEAFRVANGAADRLHLGEERNEVNQRRLDALAEHNRWIENHGDATLAQRQQHYDELRAKGYTDQELRYLGITRDVMGRPTVTPEQAHNTVSGMNARNAPPPAPPQTDNPDNDPLGIRH